MEKEKKEVEETTIPEEKTNPDESKLEEDESKSPQDEMDYKALYDEEVSRREKAEHKIVKLKTKKLEEDEPDEEDEDVKSYVDKRLREVEVKSLESQYEAEINRSSNNPDEQKLIRLYLEENTLSGSVKEQVEKAKAMANYKKLAKVNKELSLAKDTTPGGEESSTHKLTTTNVKNQLRNLGLTDRDIAYLKKRSEVLKKDLLAEYVKKYS